jgi:hypothetical protein
LPNCEYQAGSNALLDELEADDGAVEGLVAELAHATSSDIPINPSDATLRCLDMTRSY